METSTDLEIGTGAPTGLNRNAAEIKSPDCPHGEENKPTEQKCAVSDGPQNAGSVNHPPSNCSARSDEHYLGRYTCIRRIKLCDEEQ